MRYYISDLHFFHGGLNTKMDRRGFASVEEMNEYMLKRINETVRKNDELVFLGDFSLGKMEETNEILKKIRCQRLYLIRGNHDKWLNNNEYAEKRFKWIKDYAELNDDKRKVILCHYPIMSYNKQFHRNKDGTPVTWMLYGHVHLTSDCASIQNYINFVKSYPRTSRDGEEPKPAPCQMINCFCMRSNYKPLTLDEWIELEEKINANT